MDRATTQDATTLTQLQRSLRRLQVIIIVVPGIAVMAMGATIVLRHGTPANTDEIRTHRIVVPDDKGTKRVEIGQDALTTGRRDRSAGVWIFDATGHERGGMSAFADGSVTLALMPPSASDRKPSATGQVCASMRMARPSSY